MEEIHNQEIESRRWILNGHYIELFWLKMTKNKLKEAGAHGLKSPSKHYFGEMKFSV